MSNKELLRLRSLAHQNRIKTSKKDIFFYVIVFFIMICLAIIVIYPIYFMIIASVSDSNAVLNGEVYFWPKGITWAGYKKLFEEDTIWRGYLNTIIYTVVGTALNIVLTIPAGWALSRKNLPFRKIITPFLVLTMFFSGGLVPTYALMQNLGLVGNPLVMIISGGVSVYNIFMVKSYYQSNIPKEVLEASEIDGCGEFRTFFQIVLPLSKPILAVMILFYAVGHWNSYFDAMIYLQDESWFPLQLILKNIFDAAESGASAGGSTSLEAINLANQIKYSSIIVSSLPLIIIYPFFQKYFDSGFLVGSFK